MKSLISLTEEQLFLVTRGLQAIVTLLLDLRNLATYTVSTENWAVDKAWDQVRVDHFVHSVGAAQDAGP